MRSRIISALLVLALLVGFALGMPGGRSHDVAACQVAPAARECESVNLFSSVIEDVKSARETVSSTLHAAVEQWRAFDVMVSRLATATPAK